VIRNWREDKRWLPRMAASERARLYRRWQQAVTRSLDWLET
jgi:glycerol kinase